MKRRLLLSAAAVSGVSVLSGCATQNLADYAAEKPVLDLAQYFTGTLDAYGMFQDRAGRVVRRFTVVMQCSWSGPAGQEEGVLDEDFTYSDGKKERRIWRLKRQPDGSYIGRADDVVGEAFGAVSGNAFRWNYTLKLPVDDKVYEVQFDDWMYLINERVMLNTAVMSKFGIRMGQVTLSFTKRS